MPSLNYKEKKNKKKKVNKIVCGYCSKKSQYKGDCYRLERKEANKKGLRRPENSGCGRGFDDTNNDMTVVLSKSGKKQGRAMSGWQAAYLDPGAIVHHDDVRFRTGQEQEAEQCLD